MNNVADNIKYCVLHPDEVLKLGENGRKMYESNTMINLLFYLDIFIIDTYCIFNKYLTKILSLMRLNLFINFK